MGPNGLYFVFKFFKKLDFDTFFAIFLHINACRHSFQPILPSVYMCVLDNQLSNKSRALLLCGDGGVPYPESCPSMDRTGRGHLSMTSSQCGAPPADSVDVSVRGIPGGLPQYRASIKPLMDHADYQSLHRYKQVLCTKLRSLRSHERRQICLTQFR